MDTLVIFFSVLVTDFFAEMGDKTQLMLVGLTSKYKLKDIVLGTLAAIMVLNGLAVLVGGFFNQILNNYLFIVKFVAAAAFLYFSASTLKTDNDEEEGTTSGTFRFAPVAVFCTFFLAELGDKTQLTAITFGANYGLKLALVIWAACVIGFFAADLIGMLVGHFLKKNTNGTFLKLFSFVLFTIFGFYTIFEGLELFFKENPFSNHSLILPFALVLGSVGVVFAAVCTIIALRRKIQSL